MERLLWVCLAGACGTGLRYLIGLGLARWLGGPFPFGTLVVNVVGCFLIAVVMEVATARGGLDSTVRFAISAGFLGGLTTYSAFNYETTRLLEDGLWGVAALNAFATTAGCFTAGVAGLALARSVFE